jgi:ABC-type antimicrobial peptide transport system permease subunit
LHYAVRQGQLVATSVYAMRASDPLILAAAVSVVLIIALLATIVPALRATRVDPTWVVRGE